MLWQIDGHPGSEPWPLGLPGFIQGEVVLAETERGLLIATLYGEEATDDAELLRPHFEHLLETLTLD